MIPEVIYPSSDIVSLEINAVVSLDGCMVAFFPLPAVKLLPTRAMQTFLSMCKSPPICESSNVLIIGSIERLFQFLWYHYVAWHCGDYDQLEIDAEFSKVSNDNVDYVFTKPGRYRLCVKRDRYVECAPLNEKNTELTVATPKNSKQNMPIQSAVTTSTSTKT